MTVNLLPWRERSNDQRKRLLLSGAVGAVLVVMASIGLCWQILVQQRTVLAERVEDKQEILQRLQRVRQLLTDGRNETDMLEQIQSYRGSADNERHLGSAWLQWVRSGLASEQLVLTIWQVSAEALDIRFELHDRQRLSTLLALMNENGWQTAETNVEGEVISVVIAIPATE